MSRIIREARPTDMAEIRQVMDAAKAIMRQSGNMHQWGEGYPSEAVITADMERNGGLVIEDGGKVVGYFAFLPSPEPTYAKIYENIRIDTHRDNKIMQHNILKQGFTYCGIIYLQSGDALDQRSLASKGTQERLAYQKMVSR